MKPHKWAKEIKAWADGAEIEQRFFNHDDKLWECWHCFDEEWCEFDGVEYRIKPQPKEPQYLYVYKNVDKNGDHVGGYAFSMNYLDLSNYVGKIKLETEDD